MSTAEAALAVSRCWTTRQRWERSTKPAAAAAAAALGAVMVGNKARTPLVNLFKLDGMVKWNGGTMANKMSTATCTTITAMTTMTGVV